MERTNRKRRQPIGYLLLKKVRIRNANSISSPITYGFPAITGFLGAFHAISRKVQADEELKELSLGGVLLACHECEPQVYRPSSYSNYTFNQSRNPIKKDGKTASIIEEGKCHLTMTFVVEVLASRRVKEEVTNRLIEKIPQWIQQHRMAGGSVQGMAKYEPVQFFPKRQINDVIPQLMPAFVLMDAQEEFGQIIDKLQQDNANITPLDALLDISTIHHRPIEQKNNTVKWENYSVKQGHGWLVPMPIGYQGISDKYQAGLMQNVRNPKYPSQYVEAIYGLGKWLYPYHLKRNDKILSAFWRYSHDDEKQLYLTTQTNSFEF